MIFIYDQHYNLFSILFNISHCIHNINTLNSNILNFKKTPKDITVYLRSPWIASTGRVIKKENGKGFDFNKAILEKLVAEDSKVFIKELMDSGNESQQYEIIDQRLEGVKINGYEVKELPRNIKTSSVVAKTFLTVAPTNIIDAIEDIVLSNLGVKISFNKNPFPPCSFKLFS